MQHRATKPCKDASQTHQKLGVHSFFAQKRRFRRSAAGFSLIEILVALSIIALIVAVGTTVALKMTAEARRVQTREMMQGLLGANAEYKAVRQSASISHSAVSGLSSAENFVVACLQIKTCEEIMIGALNSSTSQSFDRIYKNGNSGTNNVFSIYDRWGTELEYRSSNDQTGTGPSKETGSGIANNLLPLSRDPFFASAGPDKTWGTDDDVTTLQN